MATMRDVAAQAGVSSSTVSRVLSGKIIVDPATKQRVLRAVKDLDYRPNVLAQALKDGRSKTIGLLVPNIRNLVFPAAVRGITDVARKQGYSVVLVNTDEDLETEANCVHNLRDRLVDGLIFATAVSGGEHIVKLKESGYPVVLMIRHLDIPIDAVIVDNFKGGFEATRFLIERGYREIALINGGLELQLYRQRFAGYQAALKEAGISYDEELVVHGTTGWEDGIRAMHTIWARGKMPDAVFGVSDPKAIGAIKAIKERGLKVPDDIAVIGYDNLDMAELVDPALTTMVQPFYQVGTKAAERLFKLINSKRNLRPIVEELDTKLCIRDSVGFGPAFKGEKR